MHIHVFFTMSKYLLVGGNEDTKKGCQKPHNGNLGHTICLYRLSLKHNSNEHDKIFGTIHPNIPKML